MVEELLVGSYGQSSTHGVRAGPRRGVREDAVGAQGGKINVSSSVCEDR